MLIQFLKNIISNQTKQLEANNRMLHIWTEEDREILKKLYPTSEKIKILQILNKDYKSKTWPAIQKMRISSEKYNLLIFRAEYPLKWALSSDFWHK